MLPKKKRHLNFTNMIELKAYVIGAITISIPWVWFVFWMNYQHTRQILIEKAKSYSAGFTQARNLLCVNSKSE
jgi:hypothetical protein